MLTATEQLWSVASINDISANATQKKKRKKNRKNGRNNIGEKQINAMVTVATVCKLYI